VKKMNVKWQGKYPARIGGPPKRRNAGESSLGAEKVTLVS
jgi:hypothetical protein